MENKHFEKMNFNPDDKEAKKRALLHITIAAPSPEQQLAPSDEKPEDDKDVQREHDKAELRKLMGL